MDQSCRREQFEQSPVVRRLICQPSLQRLIIWSCHERVGLADKRPPFWLFSQLGVRFWKEVDRNDFAGKDYVERGVKDSRDRNMRIPTTFSSFLIGDAPELQMEIR